MPSKRASAAKRPDLSVGGGGAFHTPHCPDGGSSLLESERRLEQAGGGSSLLESAQRRLEQAARDAFEREEGGSNDGSSSTWITDEANLSIHGYKL